MKTWIHVLAFLALAAIGCDGRVVKLDPKFAPLTEVREVTDKVPLVRDHMVATFEAECYTSDLAALPTPGSVEWDALFFHEQLHAHHELQDPFFWLRYGSKAFRFDEEKQGYAIQIRYLRAHGYTPDLPGFARLMTDDYDDMCSYDEALAFLESL